MSQESSLGFICTFATIMCGPKVFFSDMCLCSVSFIFLACLSLLLMALWRQGFLCVWFTASDFLVVDNLLFSIMSAATSVAVQIFSHYMKAIDNPIFFTHSHKIYVKNSKFQQSVLCYVCKHISVSSPLYISVRKQIDFGLIRQCFPKGMVYVILDFPICFLVNSLLTELLFIFEVV